jgi:hypothetical protein
MRELRYALMVGLAGLVLATLAVFAPWYRPGPVPPSVPVVELVAPGGVAGQP